MHLINILLLFLAAPCSMGIFFPQPGIKPVSPQWKHGVLTTPSGLKVLNYFKMLKSFLGHTQQEVGQIWPCQPWFANTYSRCSIGMQSGLDEDLSLASCILGIGRQIMNNQFSILKGDIGKEGIQELWPLLWEEVTRMEPLKSCVVVWLSFVFCTPREKPSIVRGTECPCIWEVLLVSYQSSSNVWIYLLVWFSSSKPHNYFLILLHRIWTNGTFTQWNKYGEEVFSFPWMNLEILAQR